MPIMGKPPTPAPVTQDESDRVMALVKAHASPSSFKSLATSLAAKPDPYPYPIK